MQQQLQNMMQNLQNKMQQPGAGAGAPEQFTPANRQLPQGQQIPEQPPNTQPEEIPV